MISLSVPEHGWIDLQLINEGDKIDIAFSDVGPNTLMDLRMSIGAIEDGKNFIRVPFFLEPSEAEFVISHADDDKILVIEYFMDGAKESTFIVKKSEYINELRDQLSKIQPFCVEPNWSQTL